MQRHTTSITLDGHELTFETGKIAKQANGAVIVRMGDTIVFTSVCAAKEPTPGVDFFPLRVDYQEKFSSAGKTLGGFIKREGRPTERETLISRLIDRPLRPMFEEGYYNEVQVLSFVWSYDGMNSPEPLAITCASAALALSDVPLIKPIAAVRVGFVNGKYVINPTTEQMKTSTLDLMIAGTEDAVLMIEGYCNFLTEDQVLKAIEYGHEGIKKICHTIEEWRKKIGKEKCRNGIQPPLPQELLNEVESICKPMLSDAFRTPEKMKREATQAAMKEAVVDKLLPEGEEPKYDKLTVMNALKKIQSDYMRKMILDENLRSDGRKTTDIRFIDVEHSLLPRAHGSVLFTRGETQTLAVCTLGGEAMGQRYEDLDGEGTRRFYLQYFFPPFSVGEVGRMGSPGRREVGHGKLAERAIAASLPEKAQFPYTIRLESNITESNGSSSMASVCGGCLALMNAGVPIKRPVSGIAMGLILEKNKFAILSDILGVEDALGDMDFKITGDKEGITAFQMDIKVEGITIEIMAAALKQARDGRIHILNKMLEVIPASSAQMSIYAPRIETIQIKPSQIGTIIGPGGKQIRAIQEETGVEIEISDDGMVSISCNDFKGLERAVEIVRGLVAEVEEGHTYHGVIKKIMPFGAFVEVLPGKEGLCHISEFDHQRIADLADHVKEGDKITVKVLEINDRGQIRLSRKATLQ